VTKLLGVLGAGLVDPATPLLRADDLGVLRGDGCFESVRLRAGGGLGGLEEHLDRLERSAAALALPATDRREWQELVATMVGGWDEPGEAMLRLVVTRGLEEGGRPTAFALLAPVSAEQLRQRREGVKVLTLSRGLIADATVEAPWLLGGVKAISYAVNMAAQRYAHANAADDVVFVSADGQLLEAPTATVVWLRDGVLCTPPAEPLGILAGVTVGRLFARAARHGFGTEIRRGTVDDLHAADGVWLVSSIRLAAAVTALDGKPMRVDPAAAERVQAACSG
jgi:4-amino-4-deoxychorismate lyase